MRVITGSAKGTRLLSPDGLQTRPTADRVKEALFSIIQFEVEGRQVLDNQGNPIVVTDPNEELPIGVYTFQYQDGLQHLDAGRFAANEKNGTVVSIEPQLQQGYLESSNTDLATEFGKVIEAQRAYSYALRMVTTADEVETTVNGLTNG